MQTAGNGQPKDNQHRPKDSAIAMETVRLAIIAKYQFQVSSCAFKGGRGSLDFVKNTQPQTRWHLHVSRRIHGIDMIRANEAQETLFVNGPTE